MAQLELFEDLPLISQPIAFDDGQSRYTRALPGMADDVLFVIRRRRLDGVLVGFKYAHFDLQEATLELLAGVAVKPVEVNAWVLALLMTQYCPSRREAIGPCPKLCLKRRSSNQAREPPWRIIKASRNPDNFCGHPRS